LWGLRRMAHGLEKNNTAAGKFMRWWFERAKSKSAGIEKWKFWGLAIFVGIPLPGTGAWTGAAVAVIMDYDFRKSVASIALGVLMAAVIVAALVGLGSSAAGGLRGIFLKV